MELQTYDMIQEIILREDCHEEAERELGPDEMALIWAQLVKGN